MRSIEENASLTDVVDLREGKQLCITSGKNRFQRFLGLFLGNELNLRLVAGFHSLGIKRGKSKDAKAEDGHGNHGFDQRESLFGSLFQDFFHVAAPYSLHPIEAPFQVY